MAKLLTTNVSDWVPTASLKYANTGANAARASKVLRTISKLLIIEAVNIPPNTPIINQGVLVLIMIKVEALVVP